LKIEYTFKSLHSVTSLGRYQTNSHHVLHSWVESSCSFYVENKIWVWSNIMAKIEINQNWVQLWNSHVIMLGRYLVIVGYITTAVDINEVRIYMFLFVFLRFFVMRCIIIFVKIHTTIAIRSYFHIYERLSFIFPYFPPPQQHR